MPVAEPPTSVKGTNTMMQNARHEKLCFDALRGQRSLGVVAIPGPTADPLPISRLSEIFLVASIGRDGLLARPVAHTCTRKLQHHLDNLPTSNRYRLFPQLTIRQAGAAACGDEPVRLSTSLQHDKALVVIVHSNPQAASPLCRVESFELLNPSRDVSPASPQPCKRRVRRKILAV